VIDIEKSSFNLLLVFTTSGGMATNKGRAEKITEKCRS